MYKCKFCGHEEAEVKGQVCPACDRPEMVKVEDKPKKD